MFGTQIRVPVYWKRLLKEQAQREELSEAEIVREGIMLRIVLGRLTDPDGKRVLDELHRALKDAGEG